MEFVVRHPSEQEWDRTLEILKTANFHNIGGQEMPDFPLSRCFVATSEGVMTGVGGYKILDAVTANGTLLVVE